MSEDFGSGIIRCDGGESPASQQGDNDRHEADKAAAEIFDEFAHRLESGEDPVEVLEDALGVMADEWKRSVETDSEQVNDS